ncbi:hypothetical protein FRC07_009575, partial [Ceratobasidium sp. 392]
MKDDDFGERSDDRKHGPGAKALFNKNKYMFALAEPDAKGHELPQSPQWLRDRCLITACQARKSQGATWKLTCITPSILAFTSVVVHFVLSGDPEFVASSHSMDFVTLWKKRMELLEKYHWTHRQLYKDVEKLYNTKVFPKHHKAPNEGNAVVLGQEECNFEEELDGAKNISNYGALISQLLPEPETQAGSPTAGSIAEETMELNLADLEDYSGIPSLADDQVWVQRHPASGQASSLRLLPYGNSKTSSPVSTTIPSILPFQMLADLTQTKVFVKHQASNSHVNDQLALEQAKPQNPANPLTLQSADDIHAVLELAVPADTQFQVFDFDTDFCGRKYTHRLCMQLLLAILSRMLVDPELQDHLVFYPEQIYVRNPVDDTPMQLWEESWHGDDWWNLQVSTFGGLKVWALYAWIGNVPSVLRQKWKTGGAGLIGFIPV